MKFKEYYNVYLESVGTDEEYLRLIDEGDQDALRSMVQQKAHAHGYDVIGYHGTNSAKDFTKFREKRSGSWFAIDAKHAEPNPDITTDYSNIKMKTCYLHLGKNHVLEGDKLKEWGHSFNSLKWIGDYRSFTLKGTYNETRGRYEYTDSITIPNYAYVVFDNFNIKSTDTITYDRGKIIPLSKRFDKNNPDIRF